MFKVFSNKMVQSALKQELIPVKSIKEQCKAHQTNNGPNGEPDAVSVEETLVSANVQIKQKTQYNRVHFKVNRKAKQKSSKTKPLLFNLVNAKQ